MDSKFNHSIKVPTQYKKAAKLLKKTLEEGASVKGQIFEEKHARTNRLYALISKISKHKPELDVLIQKSEILVNEPRLDKYMCLVLMTELLYGAQQLNGDSKPVQCIRNYHLKFNEILIDLETNPNQLTEAIGKTTQNAENQKPRYVRVNTNLLSRSDALEAFKTDGWQEITIDATELNYDRFLETIQSLGEFDFVSDIHVKNLFVFPASSKRFWARNHLVAESKVILQDKASCLPAMLLDPPKNSTVLDMCAAPGMKTTHLTAIMKNKGTVYAVEQHEKRYRTLVQIVKATKSAAQTIHQDALTLTDVDVPNVEYILIDPSCSGSGMTDRLFLSSEAYSPERLAQLGGLQIKILSHAMTAFPYARKIIYSTCSIFPEENEHVVERCLKMNAQWELIKPKEFAEKWKHFGSTKFKHIGKRCLYARSDIDLTDGFFVAIFQRRDDDYYDETTTTVAVDENVEAQDDRTEADSSSKKRKSEKIVESNEAEPEVDVPKIKKKKKKDKHKDNE